MTETSDTVETYFEMWNETDPTKRAELVERVWARDGRHVDPLLDAKGHAAIDAMVAGVQGQFPDHQIRRVSGIDAHHDQLRYAWQLVAHDGTVVVSAIDVGQLDDDGRLRHVVAFFGEPPQEGSGR